MRLFKDDDEHKRYLLRVCILMTISLLLTGIVAYFFSNYPTVIKIAFFTKVLFFESYWILIAIEVLSVYFILKNVLNINVIFGYLLLTTFCILVGFIISPIFLIYKTDSIILMFVYSALLFFISSITGLFLNLDYSKIGSILFSSLISLVIATLINIFFLKLDVIDWILSLAGLVIFTILISYDTKKLNEINQRGNERTPQEHKEVILGALIMYLDFINVFLRMLRLFGKKK